MTEKKQSISAIREIFAAASETELPALYLEYEEDSRAGVQNLIQNQFSTQPICVYRGGGASTKMG